MLHCGAGWSKSEERMMNGSALHVSFAFNEHRQESVTRGDGY